MGGVCRAYDTLGFDAATDEDEVFRQLVLARIVEPTSKEDSLRVLGEVGVDAASYRTVKRRLGGYAAPSWRQGLAAACAARAVLGPASLELYDVSTLYFETDRGDGFREPGFSKERRLEPQITIGLLTDAAGFPLMVEAFEGNRAETATMLPTITAFMAVHELHNVTVGADAGMVSEANRNALDDAGLTYVLGERIPDIPYQVGSGAGTTPVSRSRTVTCSSSRGRPPARRARPGGGTRRSTTSTAPTGPGGRCAASTSRSARPSGPWPARPRSSGNGSSSSPAARRA